MHLGTPALLEFCRRHGEDDSLVLATITGTEGSTYRKRGAMMLIARNGDFEGMISGGCLEGDLLEHAAGVFETGAPARVTYDMSADEDLIWSLGIGCDGVIHILLRRLDRGDGLDLFRQLERSHGQRSAAVMALVTQDGGPLETGAMALADHSGAYIGNQALAAALGTALQDRSEWRSRVVEADSAQLLLVRMPAQTRVLVCGAGPDAVPVADAFSRLGWDVVVADHRAAFARADRFPPGCTVSHQRQSALHENVDLEAIDAAVVMTHHLESDAEYLRQLSGRPLRYLGVLGPQARRRRLSEMSGCDERSLHGPVGLDLGAELPASIALSIAAEVHAVLNRRDGHSLTERCHD